MPLKWNKDISIPTNDSVIWLISKRWFATSIPTNDNMSNYKQRQFVCNKDIMIPTTGKDNESNFQNKQRQYICINGTDGACRPSVSNKVWTFYATTFLTNAKDILFFWYKWNKDISFYRQGVLHSKETKDILIQTNTTNSVSNYK